MADRTYERRLAAILSADVVGYSLLMADDPEQTVDTLSAYREAFVSAVGGHRGTVVDAKGDAILAEFPSSLDAVTAAVEIQRELARRNAALPAGRRMDFRIGINLGDVLVKDGAIYGDGVNVAARLEALAEPGGVCVSRMVHDNVEDRLDLGFEYLGEQAVKNIAKPVRAYRILLEPGARPGPASRPAAVRRRGSWRYALAGGLVLTVSTLLTLWAVGAFRGHPGVLTGPGGGRAGLTLPEKPSIAVLPFLNLSGDPEQEYFSDGITETIITDLSKLSNLFVIARNSTFAYKGKATDAREVSEELGVRYILEGSVQRNADRVRINVQLIDGTTGEHRWAERFDRPYADIFALQDEITRRIVTELDVQLVEGEQARMWRSLGNATVANYELAMKALAAFRRGTPESNAEAKRLFAQAVEQDPRSSPAVAGLGWAYVNEVRFGWTASPETSLTRLVELANRAVELDPTEAVSQSLLGFTRLFLGDHEGARAAIARAIELQPNSSLFAAINGNVLIFSGDPQAGLASIQRAMRLSPYYPAWYLIVLANANLDLGRHEEALAAAQEYARQAPERGPCLCHVLITLAYAGLGRPEQARGAAARVLRHDPDFTLSQVPRMFPYRDPDKIRQIQQTLRDAGLG